jgi:hypothetical protein
MAILGTSRGGIFTYNTAWHFYFFHRVTVLRVTQSGIFSIIQDDNFRVTQDDSFTYFTG